MPQGVPDRKHALPRALVIVHEGREPRDPYGGERPPFDLHRTSHGRPRAASRRTASERVSSAPASKSAQVRAGRRSAPPLVRAVRAGSLDGPAAPRGVRDGPTVEGAAHGLGGAAEAGGELRREGLPPGADGCRPRGRSAGRGGARRSREGCRGRWRRSRRSWRLRGSELRSSGEAGGAEAPPQGVTRRPSRRPFPARSRRAGGDTSRRGEVALRRGEEEVLRRTVLPGLLEERRHERGTGPRPPRRTDGVVVPGVPRGLLVRGLPGVQGRGWRAPPRRADRASGWAKAASTRASIASNAPFSAAARRAAVGDRHQGDGGAGDTARAEGDEEGGGGGGGGRRFIVGVISCPVRRRGQNLRPLKNSATLLFEKNDMAR